MTIAPQSVAPSSTVRAYEKDEVEMYPVGTSISQSNNGSFGHVWLAEAVGSGFQNAKAFLRHSSSKF
jgi:hypothetical protein